MNQGRTQRRQGRQTAPARRSLRWFSIAFAVVALGGVALLATLLLSGRASVATADLRGFAVRGAADAPVTVVEYADYQCPGCGVFATTQEPQLTQQYIDTGKVRLVFHDFPLTRIHPNAVAAAEAARCAGDQGQYWAMHDMLYRNQGQWAERVPPTAQFAVYGQQLGLDGAAFTQCLADGTHTAAIQAAEQAALAANIPQTPTFVVDGTLVTDMAQLIPTIDAALAAKGK